MKWYISHKSALEFWRKTLAADALSGERLYACTLPGKPADARGLRVERPWGLVEPLHVLLGGGNARKATSSLVCHVDSRRFPAGSFIQLSSEFVMSSPELCFAHMAAELSFVELVKLGFEFCGSYRLDTENEPERGFRDDVPLTNVAKLDSVISELVGLKGRENASRALRFIADGAASPMETILTMLLVLPYRFGGYGFPKPLLNVPIDVPDGTRGNGRKRRYYCDLYWPEEQVDVEYDSDAYHALTDQVYKDATRRNDLSSVGVTVVTVSRRQVVYTAELRKTAEVLSRILEKRLRCPMPEFAERHALLRSQLLSTVSSERVKSF